MKFSRCRPVAIVMVFVNNKYINLIICMRHWPESVLERKKESKKIKPIKITQYYLFFWINSSWHNLHGHSTSSSRENDLTHTVSNVYTKWHTKIDFVVNLRILLQMCVCIVFLSEIGIDKQMARNCLRLMYATKLSIKLLWKQPRRHDVDEKFWSILSIAFAI